MQFTKLFSSILDSTIWTESAEVKVVWVTMLAMSDRHGEIHSAIPGLARRAGVTIEQTEHALSLFLSPDPYSRTPDNEGRRIEVIDGGWQLLNHGKYRALLSAEERREYNRRKQAEYRAKKKAASMTVNDKSITVNHSEQSVHIQKQKQSTEAEKNKGTVGSKAASPAYSDLFEEFWKLCPVKIGKKEAFKAWKHALTKDKVPIETIMAAIPNYVAKEARRSKLPDYQKHHPAKWLKDARWDDEPENVTPIETKRPAIG